MWTEFNAMILIFTFFLEKTDSLKQIEEFLTEATMMMGFDHDNVLSLIGVVIDDFDIYVLMPFMENGNLKQFLNNGDNVRISIYKCLICVFVLFKHFYKYYSNTFTSFHNAPFKHLIYYIHD